MGSGIGRISLPATVMGSDVESVIDGIYRMDIDKKKEGSPFQLELSLSHCNAPAIFPLSGCGSLHKLDLSFCYGLTDISALGGCGSLHKLDLSFCEGLTDISPLGGCGSLHTLNLSHTGLDDISALGGCASLHTLWMQHCDDLCRTPDLSGCRYLHYLNLRGSKALYDIFSLAGCP